VSLGFLLKRFLTGLDADWLTRHLHWFGTGLDGGERIGRVRERVRPPCGERVDVLAQAMRLDYRTYLRDGLLLKLDRATMFASLEARAPYLDREVTRFALGLPSRLKVRGLTTKWLLKDVAAAWLPRAVVRRRKRGLSVPIATWLRRELRPEVDRLLSPERVARRGLLSPVIVRQLAAEHGAGREDHSRALWALLLLEYWFERWGE
jgi:asparagine synthase (glutamine-hydrolysing)